MFTHYWGLSQIHSQDLISDSPYYLLVWRIWYGSRNNPLIDTFFYVPILLDILLISKGEILSCALVINQ